MYISSHMDSAPNNYSIYVNTILGSKFHNIIILFLNSIFFNNNNFRLSPNFKLKTQMYHVYIENILF